MIQVHGKRVERNVAAALVFEGERGSFGADGQPGLLWRGGFGGADERCEQQAAGSHGKNRNPKARNPKEVRNPKSEWRFGPAPRNAPVIVPLTRLSSSLGLRISFEFRILDFGFWISDLMLISSLAQFLPSASPSQSRWCRKISPGVRAPRFVCGCASCQGQGRARQ